MKRYRKILTAGLGAALTLSQTLSAQAQELSASTYEPQATAEPPETELIVATEDLATCPKLPQDQPNLRQTYNCPAAP